MNRMVYLKGVATLRVFEEKCVRCGMCLEVCPHAVLSLNGGKVKIEDLDACMECGACMQNCPAGAISVKSGVGCANAIINTILGRKNDSCCCVIEEKEMGSEGCKNPTSCF
ncbi:MAG: 4Fe-4S binding protein [Syntrophaceae bacterium]|nr:4Fe-4S binding protein [Syntrophaceae bacterium]